MTKVAIAGAPGRMGRTLIQALQNNKDEGLQLSAAIHREGSSFAGMDSGEIAGIGKNGVLINETLESVIEDFDLLIDFTLVEPTLRHLEICQHNGKSIVIGTTGFNDQQKEIFANTARSMPILIAPNMSVGVNLCLHLLRQTAEVMGEEADIEIIETHHRHKLDAPSGTALRMGEVIANQMGQNLTDCAVYGREGISEPRDSNTIGFATVRAGDVVGDHTVLFATEGERLEITHKASNRLTFANGAVKAAKWLSTRSNGLYDMADVLNLKSL